MALLDPNVEQVGGALDGARGPLFICGACHLPHVGGRPTRNPKPVEAEHGT
jgi:hypothetical protein